jgi:hypothetical protein
MDGDAHGAAANGAPQTGHRKRTESALELGLTADLNTPLNCVKTLIPSTFMPLLCNILTFFGRGRADTCQRPVLVSFARKVVWMFAEVSTSFISLAYMRTHRQGSSRRRDHNLGGVCGPLPPPL